MSLPCSRSRKAASAPGRSVHVISGYLINVASHRGAERWRHKSADRSIVRRASAPPFCRTENDFFKQKGGLWELAPVKAAVEGRLPRGVNIERPRAGRCRHSWAIARSRAPLSTPRSPTSAFETSGGSGQAGKNPVPHVTDPVKPTRQASRFSRRFALCSGTASASISAVV